MADNFQDNVSYGGSTLAVSGDAIAVGSTNNGAKSVIFNNSGSQGHLVWQPVANQTITLPNSNGVVQLTGQVPGAIAAGGQTATSGTVIFSNSNGLSFGLNGQTVTASYTVPSTAGLISAVNVSAGTTSNNLSAITFSNANNISFGLNGSTVTATATFNQTNQTVGLYALGNTTQNSSTTLDARTLSFNGLGAATVGYSNGSIQISVPTQTVQTQSLIAAVYDGANSISTGTIRFSNSNGVSFGINGQTITASHNGITSQTNQSVGLYALGNTTQNSSTTLDARSLSFNGLGIITAGYSNGSIQLSATTAAQTNQTLGLYGVGNTTGQSSSSTFDARTLSFSGAGIASVGYSNGNVIVSVPAGGGGITNINVSAGTTSNNLSALTFSNSNGISFGLDASTITASHNGITSQTNQTAGLYAVGNTTGQSSSTTADARSLSFSGAGIASVGYSGGSVVISVPSGGGGLTNINVSAGTTSNNLSAITFSNVNGISFGLDASTITASYTVPTQTNQTVGLYALGNTTQNSSTTLDARTLSLNGLGAATVGYSNGSIQISAPNSSQLFNAGLVTFSTNGNSITISGNMNFSAGTTSSSLTAVTFNNGNGVSFGLNGATITASVAAQTVQTQSLIAGVYDGANSISTGTIRFTNANGVSFSINGQTISGSVAAQTNQTLGLYAVSNTTQNSSTTLDARTLSLQGAGNVSVGYSNGSIVVSGGGAGTVNFSAGTTSNNLTNIVFSNSNGISFGLNGSTITASVPAVAGSDIVFSNSNNMTFGKNVSTVTASAPISFSAGTTNNNLTNIVFGNSNGINFGLNGSTITASQNAVYTFDPYPVNSATAVLGLGTNTSAPAYFFPFIIDEAVAAGWLNVAQSMSFVTNGTSSGQQSITISYGLYSRGTGTNNSTLSAFTSGSYPLFVTGNNSSYTIGQPTSTDNAGYTTSTTGSAGSNISSGYTGGKLIVFPIGTTLTPGQYWLGLFQRASTSSINVGISQSFIGVPVGTTLANLAPIGSFSSAFSTGTAATNSRGGNWYPGLGSFTSAGQTNLPGTVALSAMTNNLSVIPFMRFYSTV